MDDYRKYLAENVLSEEKVITYRFLSRALKVHVNTAKQMLYDFHKWQNDKRPSSVHATYLIYGAKKEEPAQISQDGDVEMASSPPEQELQDVVPIYALRLVPESDLKVALEEYEEVKSLHVYSLGPHPTKDAALLSDAARQVSTLSAPGDSALASKIYGTISNTQVWRRERKGAGAKLAAAASAPAPKVQPKPTVTPAPAPAQAQAKAKEEQEPEQKPVADEKLAAKGRSTFAQAKKPTPALKRGGSSIMASFAKGAAAQVKKTESRQATPSGDDSNHHQMSDDESEEDSAVLPKPKAQDASSRKSRQQVKDDLQRMMDDEEEEEEVKEKEETPEEEPMEEEPAPEPEKEEPAEVIASTGDGRRRGKRKVMKKKQILDDQGYLVTIQEAGWESFSEDEAPKPTPAPAPVPASKPKPSSAPAAVTSKAKKAAGPKGSQGSIMSFFGKKT